MSSFGFVFGLTGCQSYNDSESTTKRNHKKALSLSPIVKKVNRGWAVKVVVRNEDDWDASFRDIQVLAYTPDGTKVCESHVGDLLQSGDFKRTVEMTCSAFPTIITATARESPCENALIPVIYWVGSKAQKTATIASGEIVWKDVYRQCEEALPPQRVLEKFETSG
jgi:hypothetical protein